MAGSSKGYKHTGESLEKIRKATLGRTHTNEVRQLMRESRIGVNNHATLTVKSTLKKQLLL
jgi:hypothetical protein